MIEKINGIDLFYEKTGSGSQNIILLHGNGEDHHIFDKLTDRLKADFVVYSIDSRNHGKSSSTGEYSYDAMVEDVYKFIQQLSIDNVSIIGFSDGAIIALLLELKYPAILCKMALLGINLNPNDFKPEIYKYLEEEFEKTKNPLIQLMLEQPDIQLKSLSHVAIPVLVVAAEDDLFKPDLYSRIADMLPHAKLLVMEGADHGSYVINNDILYDDLKSFLKEDKF